MHCTFSLSLLSKCDVADYNAHQENFDTKQKQVNSSSIKKSLLASVLERERQHRYLQGKQETIQIYRFIRIKDIERREKGECTIGRERE